MDFEVAEARMITHSGPFDAVLVHEHVPDEDLLKLQKAVHKGADIQVENDLSDCTEISFTTLRPPLDRAQMRDRVVNHLKAGGHTVKAVEKVVMVSIFDDDDGENLYPKFHDEDIAA